MISVHVVVAIHVYGSVKHRRSANDRQRKQEFLEVGEKRQCVLRLLKLAEVAAVATDLMGVQRIVNGPLGSERVMGFDQAADVFLIDKNAAETKTIRAVRRLSSGWSGFRLPVSPK
jgi:hypothetical protein